MEIFQRSIFNGDDFILDDFHCFGDLYKPLIDVIEYPNLPEHHHLVGDVQAIMSKNIGDSLKISDYLVHLIEFNENERPVYIDNDEIFVMWRDDFTVHYYWCVILLTIYKLKYCCQENETDYSLYIMFE